MERDLCGGELCCSGAGFGRSSLTGQRRNVRLVYFLIKFVCFVTLKLVILASRNTFERKIFMKSTGLLVFVAFFGLQSGSWLLAADVAPGKAAYEKSCVGCHGADGKGNPAMAKALGEKGLNLTSKEAKGKSDAELLKVIAGGAGKMPASKNLSAEEQKQVLSYVRSLMK
ncbi:MAG TPA: cytochrome c [Candidatus Binatia bacterium]